MTYRRFKAEEEFALNLIVGGFVLLILFVVSYFVDPYEDFRKSFEFFKLLILYFPIAVIILVFATYRFSYKLTVADGKIIETQLFRNKREVNFAEITGVEGGRFYSAGIFYPFPTQTLIDTLKHKLKKSYIFPKIKNAKFISFPRYALEGNLAQELKNKIPNLPIDQELLLQYEARTAKANPMHILLLVIFIAVISIVVYLLYSIGGGFGSVF